MKQWVQGELDERGWGNNFMEYFKQGRGKNWFKKQEKRDLPPPRVPIYSNYNLSQMTQREQRLSGQIVTVFSVIVYI